MEQRILSLETLKRGVLTGTITAVIIAAAEAFANSLYGEAYFMVYVTSLGLHLIFWNMIGIGLSFASYLVHKVSDRFLRRNLNDEIFFISFLFTSVIFIFGFYYLNRLGLPNSSFLSLMSLSADLIFLVLCMGLFLYAYRFFTRSSNLSLSIKYLEGASVALFLLVAGNYHFFILQPKQPDFLRAVVIVAGYALLSAFGISISFLLSKYVFKSQPWFRTVLGLAFSVGLILYWGPPTARNFQLSQNILSAEQRQALKDKPNIIWIVMDTARRDNLSCYGYPVEVTPNIDQFAAEGVKFTNAITTGAWTCPTHASMFTGMFPSKHGSHHSDLESPVIPLAEANLTIAEILKERGYQTAAMVANHSVMSYSNNFDQGFDFYFDDLPRTFNLFWGFLCPRLYRSDILQQLRLNRTNLSSELNDVVFEWLDKHQENPLFLFINYMEAHGHIFHLPEPYDSMYGFRREDEEIYANFDIDKVLRKQEEITQEKFDFHNRYVTRKLTFLDHNIGKLFDKLKEMNMYDDAMIIITSDHGDLRGEHYTFAHSTDLYDELLRVPLIVKYPKSMHKKGVVDKYVQTLDIMPEILDVLDFPIPSMVQGQPFDEVEHHIIAELWRQGNVDLTKNYPARFYRDLKAIFTDDDETLKFIFSSNEAHEAFNLASDPKGLNNVIEQFPDKSKAWQDTLRIWRASFEPVKRTSGELTHHDKETLDRLRALGYIK